jgi:hypothetical protein
MAHIKYQKSNRQNGNITIRLIKNLSRVQAETTVDGNPMVHLWVAVKVCRRQYHVMNMR